MKKQKLPVLPAIPEPPGTVPAAGPGTPPPPRARLNTFCGIKAHMAWVIKNLEAGLLDPKVGNSLTVALSSYANLMEKADLEDRVQKLERHVEGN